MQVSEALQEELKEVATTRRRWWVVKFDEGLYGEVVDEDADEGFDLKLFSTKKSARAAALAFLEGDDIPFEVVEICWSEVGA